MITSCCVLVLVFTCGLSSPVPPSTTANAQNVKYTEYTGEPAVAMFRNFVSSFPPYANPLNYIPKAAYPGGYGQPGSYGMGFAGPFTGTGYGSPHPFYGLKPPIVPGYPGAPGAPGIPGVPGSSGGGLDTRIAGGGSFAGSASDGSSGGHVAVTADSADGQPIFRSKTFQGPDSHGSAFAYSSG